MVIVLSVNISTGISTAVRENSTQMTVFYVMVPHKADHVLPLKFDSGNTIRDIPSPTSASMYCNLRERGNVQRIDVENS